MRSLGLMGAWVLVSCAAVAVAGCGDDDDTDGTGASGTGASSTGGSGGSGTGATGTGGSTGGDGGMGGSGGAATVSYEITVLSFDGSDTIEDAGVAIDLVDGSRVEGLTDAMGVATLELPADVDADYIIAHKDGGSMVSFPMAILSGTSIDLFIGPDPDTSGLVAVTGTASNMNDPADRLLVVATPGSAFNEAGVAAYDVLVEPSTDFSLFAVDLEAQVTGQDFLRTFHSNVYSQQTGITAPAVVDIDFANPTALAGNFTLSVAAPEDATLNSAGSLAIDVASPAGPKGASNACTHDAVNDRFDCTGEIWDSGAAADLTIYTVAEQAVHEGGHGRSTTALVVGAPPSGLVSPNFPNAPDVTAPAGAGPHPIDTVVQFSVAPGGGAYDFVLANINAPDGRLIGITFSDQMGEMRIPALPSSSDPATLYEASMNMNFFTCTQGPTNQCIGVGAQSWEASPPAN